VRRTPRPSWFRQPAADAARMVFAVTDRPLD
jgi:hypothetical protein